MFLPSRFIRFLLVGASATALHYAVMTALLLSGQLPPGPSSACGFAVSSVFNYLANARFTFDSEGGHGQKVPRFVLVSLCGLALNQIVLLGLLSFSLPVAAAQLAATGAVVFWNYVLSSIWTFRTGGQT